MPPAGSFALLSGAQEFDRFDTILRQCAQYEPAKDGRVSPMLEMRTDLLRSTQ
jgi:hypothetical protein